MYNFFTKNRKSKTVLSTKWRCFGLIQQGTFVLASGYVVVVRGVGKKLPKPTTHLC